MEENFHDSNSIAEFDGSAQDYFNAIYFLDVILLLANIIALIANAIILYVMGRIKFWRTPVYTLITNLALMDILHLLTSPGLLKWYKQVHDFHQDFRFYMVHGCLNFAFELGIILILFILLYVETVKSFKKYCLQIICTIWCIVVLFCIPAFAGIANSKLHSCIVFLFAMRILLLIVTIVTCITFFVKKKHLDKEFKLRMAMASVYVCFWLCYAFVDIMMRLLGNNMVPLGKIVQLVFAIGEMDAVANLYLLTTLDRTFNIFFHRIFNCRSNNSDDVMNTVHEDQTGGEV